MFLMDNLTRFKQMAGAPVDYQKVAIDEHNRKMAEQRAIRENCGGAHENEEVAREEIPGEQPDKGSEGEKVDCPICKQSVSKEGFYDHMTADHSDMESGGDDDKVVEPTEDEPSDDSSDEPVDADGSEMSPEPNGDEMYSDDEGKDEEPSIEVTRDDEPLEDEPTDDESSEEDEYENEEGTKKVKGIELSLEAKKEDSKKSAKDAADDTVFDNIKDKDESPESAESDNVKTAVPKEIVSALEKEIKELRAEVEELEDKEISDRDKFYDHTANAFERIRDLLKQGDDAGYVDAQIHMQTLMSPMIQRLPDEVFKFLSGGGKPKSLRALFHEVKTKK